VDYLNGQDIDQKLRQAGITGNAYFLQDHLGSTVALANGAGTVLERGQYEAFGANANTSLTRYAFTGRELDAVSGMIYYRARWYDTQQGRFISEDPTNFTDGPNLYAYVGDDPVNFYDPLGEGKFGLVVRVGKWGLKKIRNITKDEAKRLYKKQGKDISGSKKQLKKFSKEKGKPRPEKPEKHGEGTYHYHLPDRRGGHGFIVRSNAIIPGAFFGRDLFGDGFWGNTVDFFNPLSDLQDLLDLFSDDDDDDDDC
jgi:RHS repeat-associated protein